MIKKFSATIFVLMLVFTVGCAGAGSEPTEKADQGKKIKIVTSIPPIYSIVLNLTEGTNTEVVNLVGPGKNIHNFQLTPQNAKDIETADLIVINGLGLEEFLEDITEEHSEKTLIASDAVPIKKINWKTKDYVEEDRHQEEEIHEEMDEHEGDHSHGETDPHVWLNPMNAFYMAEYLVPRLKAIDPSNAEVYDENLLSLAERMENLRSEISQRIEALDINGYLVFHDAYIYFEKAFGTENSGSVEEFTGKQPGAQRVGEIVKMIDEGKVKVIFVEPQSSSKIVDTLTEDGSVKKGQLDPLGSELSAEGYFKMMEGNVAAFEEVFGEVE